MSSINLFCFIFHFPLQSGDRKLAQSAQMYHYQHQKQQMIAMQKWVYFAPFMYLTNCCNQIFRFVDTATRFSEEQFLYYSLKVSFVV